MLMRIPAALFLFCLSFSILPAAHGQSCMDLLRQASAHQSGHTVSVGLLRVSPKARQHFEKARLASERNQMDVFEREAAQALAAEPKYGEVYLLRAAVQLRSGRPEVALETVVGARAMQTDLPWSGVLMASIFNYQHRYREAMGELDRARGEEADSWQAKYERARAETGLRNPEDAIHWSELAVAAAPVGCTDVRLVRANAFQMAGRQREALVELEAFLALDRRGVHRPEVLAAIEQAHQRSEEQGSGLIAME